MQFWEHGRLPCMRRRGLSLDCNALSLWRTCWNAFPNFAVQWNFQRKCSVRWCNLIATIIRFVTTFIWFIWYKWNGIAVQWSACLRKLIKNQIYNRCKNLTEKSVLFNCIPDFHLWIGLCFAFGCCLQYSPLHPFQSNSFKNSSFVSSFLTT